MHHMLRILRQQWGNSHPIADQHFADPTLWIAGVHEDYFVGRQTQPLGESES